jgi:hypothetical protein
MKPIKKPSRVMCPGRLQITKYSYLRAISVLRSYQHSASQPDATLCAGTLRDKYMPASESLILKESCQLSHQLKITRWFLMYESAVVKQKYQENLNIVKNQRPSTEETNAQRALSSVG